MNNLADEKFDFDNEFSDDELEAIGHLSVDELDLDLDDEDFDLSTEELAALEEEVWEEAKLDAGAAASAKVAVTQKPDVIRAAPESFDAPVVQEAPSKLEAELPARQGIFDDVAEEPLEHDHRPVPRINIFAFCETQGVSNLLEKAAQDRRLLKAHISIQMGGAQRAADHFQDIATPNLIILETVNAGAELEENLMSLAEVCDPSTKVIIIGAINDITLYRDLIAKGISDYIVAPKKPIHIIRSIAELYVDPDAPPIGKAIAFVGARGGVGSSTLSHNVAWYIAEKLQSDTVLLDLDLAFGTGSLDFERDPSQGLAEALEVPERLDDVLLDRLLQKCTDRLSLFAAPNMLDRDYDIPADSYETVLDIVRTAAPTVIIDIPHVWDKWAQHILKTADEIVLTATPDLASFRNAKSIMETLIAQRGNDALPYVVLNQMDVPKRPEVPFEQFEEALGVKPFTSIGWDPVLFGTASTNGEPVFETNAKAKASDNIAELSRLLLGVGEATTTAKKSFDLKKLLGKK